MCWSRLAGGGMNTEQCVTVDWVLLGSGKLEKGSIYMQIVCRRTLPLGRKSM